MDCKFSGHIERIEITVGIEDHEMPQIDSMPTKLKGEFYRTTIRPAMTYGDESCPNKKQHVHKVDVAEMRMLRWTCVKIRKDKIRNECF